MVGNSLRSNMTFVQGIEGARAYQIPYGFDRVALFDTENDIIYLKAIDDMGRPFIMKAYEYIETDIPGPQAATQVPQIDTSNLISKEQLESILSRLYVNPQGRIMLSDESSK